MPADLTPEEIAELRAKVEAMAPEPWQEAARRIAEWTEHAVGELQHLRTETADLRRRLGEVEAERDDRAESASHWCAEEHRRTKERDAARAEVEHLTGELDKAACAYAARTAEVERLTKEREAAPAESRAGVLSDADRSGLIAARYMVVTASDCETRSRGLSTLDRLIPAPVSPTPVVPRQTVRVLTHEAVSEYAEWLVMQDFVGANEQLRVILHRLGVRIVDRPDAQREADARREHGDGDGALPPPVVPAFDREARRSAFADRWADRLAEYEGEDVASDLVYPMFDDALADLAPVEPPRAVFAARPGDMAALLDAIAAIEDGRGCLVRHTSQQCITAGNWSERWSRSLDLLRRLHESGVLAVPSLGVEAGRPGILAPLGIPVGPNARGQLGEPAVQHEVREHLAAVRGADAEGVSGEAVVGLGDRNGAVDVLAGHEGVDGRLVVAHHPSNCRDRANPETESTPAAPVEPAPVPGEPRHPHIVDGEFQSDKYPTCPRGKVPLSVKDPTAQDLLWTYAQRRRSVDAEFSDDLEWALRSKGYEPAAPVPPLLTPYRTPCGHGTPSGTCSVTTPHYCETCKLWYGDETHYVLAAPVPPEPRDERAPVPAEVHERGWQWRPVDGDTAFAPPFATIRVCRSCDCLVAGGPNICGRCAKDAAAPVPPVADVRGGSADAGHCRVCGGTRWANNGGTTVACTYCPEEPAP